MEKGASVHISVLEREVVEMLRAKEGGTFVDCTLGGGGHTAAILAANPANTVVAIDRDGRAVERARIRFSDSLDRVSLREGKFSSVESLVKGSRFDGMLVDLGISTDQLTEERGFSFNDDAPLDMRMDETQSLSASTVVNEYPEKDLLRVMKRGGVGSEAGLFAKAIIRARPIETTKALATVINQAAPAHLRKKKSNPATVAFQAIRIEVNDEFGEIKRLMDSAPRVLAKGGRLAIITFHSLEDREVTHHMRGWGNQGDYPASWRGHREASLGHMVQNKAITPSEEEVERNPSSRSARLRVFEFFG